MASVSIRNSNLLDSFFSPPLFKFYFVVVQFKPKTPCTIVIHLKVKMLDYSEFAKDFLSEKRKDWFIQIYFWKYSSIFKHFYKQKDLISKNVWREYFLQEPKMKNLVRRFFFAKINPETRSGTLWQLLKTIAPNKGQFFWRISRMWGSLQTDFRDRAILLLKSLISIRNSIKVFFC